MMNSVIDQLEASFDRVLASLTQKLHPDEHFTIRLQGEVQSIYTLQSCERFGKQVSSAMVVYN